MADNFKTHKVLLPFAWLYGLGIGIRNKLFDRNILSAEEFPVPVISIGNISVGGTGKTPHTEYLIRLLSNKYKVAVLSRGYKRKSKGFVLADERASVQTVGDEPYQMFRKFPAIWVAVDSNRRRGIKKLLALPETIRPTVILLDDAFQHRYVKPSLAILLTDYNRLFYKDLLLPAGRLRESGKAKKRAQIIIVTKCPDNFTAVESDLLSQKLNLASSQELYFTSYQYKGLLPAFPGKNPVKKEDIHRLKIESYAVLLFTGIAEPSGLTGYLKNYILDLHTLVYPDHHAFSPKNIRKITRVFTQIKNENKIILTSEKDFVRLLENSISIPEEIKPFIFYIPIEIIFNFDPENTFIQKIENHVANFERNRILA